MSLTDLKKGNGKKVKKKNFTVDEFISDAESYAKGTGSIVKRGEEVPSQSLNLKDAIAFAEQKVTEREQYQQSNKPFRHATFTLSEDAIEQLNQLSKDSSLAKSHIVRILIGMLSHKDRQAQLDQLLNTKIQ